ncbi:hypothetical protein [Methylobacterium sp. Leaf125]|uniref:hypothetical protein n=1 Tax=Methylobacterium sp. Leaf125 TaxID=1736265 RepID=UPI0012E0E61A|nr:hypothetical protein [Methylobacterium sp. Leaf125]
MLNFLGRHIQSALAVALVGSLIATGTSLYTAYVTFQYQSASQDRQIMVDRVNKFDSSGSEIVEAISTFLKALNARQELSDSKEKFRSVLSQQVQEAESLNTFLGGVQRKRITDYQSAVINFNKQVQSFSNQDDIGNWVENVGRLLDTRRNLVRYIQTDLKRSV